MTSQSPIHHIPVNEKIIAFTFDDGPNPLYTPQILEIFEQYNGKATFFVIGNQIEKHPEIARMVHEQGHELANHTYTHPAMAELNEEQLQQEVLQAEKLIEDITGKKPQSFRPPYFSYNDTVAEYLSSLSYNVFGAVNTEALDWEQPGIQHIVDKTKETVAPGSILIFHDGFGDRSQTVEAVRILAAELTAEGYSFVTANELLARAI